jgi:16S rRNA (cytosine1407-C5)-methyltransferase
MVNISIGEIRLRLGENFCNKFENVFGGSFFEKILRGFSCERKPCVRVNTLKTSCAEMMKKFRETGVGFERIPFLADSLIIKNKNEKFFEDLEIYKNGEIYFQGVSSQLPAVFLGCKSGEKVLDMCAAPGSKTAQIGIFMGNRGEILANEFDKIRAEKLKFTLDRQGVSIAKIRLGDGVSLGHEFPETFDKVLLDAPCSAEGRINISEPRSYKFWSEKVVKKCADLQKRLILSGFKALKKGGVLVYSTCTLAPEEDEEIVNFLLEKGGDEVEILKLNLVGFEKYLLPVKVKNCLKIMPSEVCEGFFVAGFRKK